MKSTISMLAVLLCAASSVFASDTEPNNSQATASPLALNVEINGSLGAADIDDWYVITLPGSGNVVVTANYTAPLAGFVYIHNPAGSSLAFSAGGSGAKTVSSGCIGTNTIYVRANRTGGEGSYTLSVALVQPTHANDAEPNNSIAEVQNTYLAGQTFTGRLGYVGTASVTDSDDWFAYTHNTNGSVTFSVTADEGLNIWVYLYRADGTQIGFSTNGSGLREYTAVCQAQGTLYGRISRSSGCGSYTAVFTSSAPPNANDAEPNNNIGQVTATYVNGQGFTGQLGYTASNGVVDTEDWFAFTHNGDGIATFSVTADAGLNIWVYLYRADGTQIGFSTNGSGLREYTANCQAQGTLYGRINRSGGCGSYTAVFTSSLLPNANDAEPNNNIGQVTATYVNGQGFTGHLGYTSANGSVDTEDWFEYTHSSDGNVTFSVTADAGLNIWVYLYRADGTQIGFSSNGSGLREYTANCQAQGTLYGRINRSSGCGSYTAVFSSAFPTFGNDAEPNTGQSLATFTHVTKVNEGRLGYFDSNGVVDTDDWYTIKITQAPITLTFPVNIADGLTANVWFHNGAGAFMGGAGALSGAHNVSYTFNSTGVYYIRMNRSVGCGSYSFGAPCPGGGDVDKDNICDTEDSCIINGGIVSTINPTFNLCRGDGVADIIQATVANKLGQGTFGLVTFPALDIVATNATGTFNMEIYPSGSYRIGYVSVPSLAALQGITNVNQLTGCFDLSNTISVTSIALIPGTISATAGTIACGDDGIPSNLSFSVAGAQGPLFRWVVLTADGSTALANNTTGTFEFDQFGPGTYRVARVVYTNAVNIATVNPLALPPCIRASNLLTITITSCAPAIQVMPNPNTGQAAVSFKAAENSMHNLEVFDMQGRRVAALFNQVAEEGLEYRNWFDGSNLSNGIYLVRLSTPGNVLTEKIIINR